MSASAEVGNSGGRAGFHPREVLARDPEPMPAWLARFSPGDRFDPDGFFGGRVVYYPGSGWDGQAVKLFGGACSAHAFILADYGLEAEAIQSRLDRAGTFRGYCPLARVPLMDGELVPGGWVPTVLPSRPSPPPSIRPYAFLQVLERMPAWGADHGPERLAILFIGGDGIATFDALFAQHGSGRCAPFGVVLQDHGFGGNYDSFGAGGLLARIAWARGIHPQWLWVAGNTRPWPGYEPVPEAWPIRGGSAGHLRRLYAPVYDR